MYRIHNARAGARHVRVAALVLLLGLYAAPLRAQDFAVETSEPAHGDVGVALADTVAFSFTQQVGIGTDWNHDLVFEPNDALSVRAVSLCLTFLDRCDAGDDIPRHVRYRVDHEPNTDYTWLVYGVQTVDGVSMAEPYVLRYTTASDIGQETVTGSVSAPGAKATRSSQVTASLRKLGAGLLKSGLGRPVYERPDSISERRNESAAPPELRTSQIRTLGPKTGTEGPFTHVLLLNKFSIVERYWTVRAADALVGSSGEYALTHVRSGSYVPIAVRYTDGTHSVIDALGFHDPDGDGTPNAVEVDGTERTGVHLQLYDFPRTTARAEANLPAAVDTVAHFADDQELRSLHTGPQLRPSGRAYEWSYVFYSPSAHLETEVTVNPLAVEVDTSSAPDYLAEMRPLPDDFVDSDVALQTALDDGGQAFVDSYSERTLRSNLAGGNFFWLDPPSPSDTFWHVRLLGVTQTDTQTFESFVNMETGEILPVEMTGFDASVAGSTVNLRWHTASETNNAGFAVEHATGDTASAASWTELGFVPGAGTTEDPQTYRFRATDLDPGTHRFRLRQVDLDGTAHLSRIESVHIEMDARIHFPPPSPNPVRQTATLRVGAREAVPATVAVYDLLGRRVLTLYDDTVPPNAMQTLSLDASRLSSGVYFVRLATGDVTRTHKITVRK